MNKTLISLCLGFFVFVSTTIIVEAAANPIPSASAPSSAVQTNGSPPASYLQTIKILQENKHGENEIKSFVYQVFSLFDRHAEISQLLLLFADEDLIMQLPEGTINSHNDFEKWYAGIGAKYQSNTHKLERVDVQIPSKGDYRVDLTVHWQALGIDGKFTSFRSRQLWKIVDGGGYWPRIVQYRVEPAI
jgi:hypothetical protein